MKYSQALVKSCVKVILRKYKMITLKDIAKDSGFSVSVVSRALNPKPDQKVAEMTKLKIEESMRKLNYRRNYVASSLAKGRSSSIGLFLSLPNYKSFLTTSLIDGLSKVANSYGLSYNIYYGINGEDYSDFLESSKTTHNSGVIIYNPEYNNKQVQTRLNELENCGCKIVILNGNPHISTNITNCSINNYIGGELATEHLIANQCENFIHITTNNFGWQMQERTRGFCETINNCGKTFKLLEYEELNSALNEAIKRETPTGIFLNSDLDALKVYGIIQKLNKNNLIGKKIKIVGFDNSIYTESIYPALSSIEQPFVELGSIGMSLLLNKLINANIKIDLQLLKPKLFVRESSSGIVNN